MRNKLSQAAPCTQNFHDYVGTVKAEGSIVSMETFTYRIHPRGTTQLIHIPYKMDFNGGFRMLYESRGSSATLISDEENESTEKNTCGTKVRVL